jgi:1-acyl-sn-glycerol-3-phosphate acyltransferase
MLQTLSGTAATSRARLNTNGLRDGARLLGDFWVPPVRSPARLAFGLQRLCQSLCRAHGIVPIVHGEAPRGPKLLVSNHKGYIDPVAICSVVPTLPIAKSEVRQWPLIGSIAERYGALFVERGNPFSGANVLRRAVRRLAGGANVLNFPEGTTRVGLPEQFQTGVFGLSRLVELPIVPIRLSFENPELCWVDEQTFVPHYLKSLRSKPHVVHVTFGPALRASEYRSDRAHADAALEWIRAGLSS